MKSTTKFCLAATVALVVGTTGFNAYAAKMKVAFGNEPYPPFTETNAKGEWVGWEIDIGKAICEAAKIECELAPVAWDGIIPALKTKKIDMIIGSMDATPERSKEIDFTDKYYQVDSVLVGPKSKKFGTAPADLKGKILGVQVSTTFAAYVDAHYKSVVKQVKTYQTQDEEMQDLVAGRVDVVQADIATITDFLKGAGKACCEMKGKVPADPATLGSGIAVGIRKGEDALKAKINMAIKQIRKDGTYKKITDKYNFGYDIYGG